MMILTPDRQRANAFFVIDSVISRKVRSVLQVANTVVTAWHLNMIGCERQI